MLRTWLVLLLLTHYLLVVGAGLVGRPEPPRQRAASYVHSLDCQQKHYLQLDCFDHCNGEQYARPKPGSHDTLAHFLSTLKGLDVHCLTAEVPQVAFRGFATQAESQAPVLPVPAGFRAAPYAPPRRG